MAVLLNGTNGLIQAYDYQTPTTGFSYTFVAGTQTLVMNPAGTLATGTITMPASPSDGMTITISTTQQITALTLSGNAGQTIVGGVNSLAATQAVSFIYRSANTSWFPMTTQVAEGTGPAFRAYRSAAQTLTNGVDTKIAINTEVFDTNNNFDSTTNYRFTPTVAGYYQFSASVYSYASGGLSYNYIQFYKNGAQANAVIYGPYNTIANIGSISALIYLNGSTDYVELYTQIAGSGTIDVNGGATFTFFSGFLARAA